MPDQLHTICSTDQWEDWTHMQRRTNCTIYCHRTMRRLDPHAMPDQLNTIYFHKPMRRLDMYIRYMPHRASCNRFTVNDQWEGCAKPTTRRYRPMRRMQSYLSMLCPAHCLLSIATNEKTRCPSNNIDQWEDVTHIFSHCERPAACNSTLHSRQPMRKLHSSHLKSATDIYLNIWWLVNQLNSISSTVTVQSQVKSTKPNHMEKHVLRILNYVTLFIAYSIHRTHHTVLWRRKKMSCIRKNAFFYICFFKYCILATPHWECNILQRLVPCLLLSLWLSDESPESPKLIHGPNNIKTPNPKCRLYWCSIEFIDWRYRQSCWYFFFDPSCELAPL